MYRVEMGLYEAQPRSFWVVLHGAGEAAFREFLHEVAAACSARAHVLGDAPKRLGRELGALAGYLTLEAQPPTLPPA